MTEKQLMEALTSAVSEDHVSKTLEGMKKASTRRKARGAALAAAACLCLVVGTFFTVSHFTRESAPESDFVIEDGVLLAYNGNDTDVVVPEEVHTITRTSFTSGSTDIRTISLGRNVSEIDKAAFVGLSSLKSVEVSEENDYYASIDGVLGRRDGTVFFGTMLSAKDLEKFMAALYKLADEIEMNIDVTEFVFGEASMRVRFLLADEDYFTNGSCMTESVSAFGHTKVYTEPTELFGNVLPFICQTDGIFAFGDLHISGDLHRKVEYGNFTVITKEGVFEIENPTEPLTVDSAAKDYNAGMTVLKYRDDGKIGYERSPRKFVFLQSVGGDLSRLVSRDEFARETGYIVPGEDGLDYVPEKTYTADEVFDLDGMYEEVLNCAEAFPDDIRTGDDGVKTLGGIALFDSVDGLIEYNAGKFERAYR